MMLVSIQKDMSKMHIKNKWIRSFLFMISGLMLATGVSKVDNQVYALIATTIGFASLLSLLSQDPRRGQE